jgi:membrane-bound serine protease (ClpP class)
MDKSKGLKIGETVISGTGSVLSLSAGEAVRVIDGKTVFAKSIANSLDDVVKGEKWPGAVHVFEPTGFESVAFWLNTLAPLLLLVGLLAGYIEFKTPGFGIPGFISAICFLLFFSANYLAGLAGFELAVLFFLGFALVLIELLFFPGVLLLGVPGVLLMVACLLFAMVDAYPNQGLNIPLESFLGPMTTLAATILASGIIMAVIAKFLPKTPGLRHLVLASSVGDVKASIRRDASLGTEIGAVGTAITYLRPSGKGAFDGQVLDVITRGEFIPRDTAIRILRFDANAVVVEAVEAAS